jgi:ABC-type multidrug transport system fused ATPase/permease subunit
MSHYIVVGKIDNNNIMNPYNNPTDFNNNDTDEIERIDISDIFWNSLMNNKILLFAMVPLFIGYYLQDVVFTKSIAQLTTHLTEFVDDISIMKVFIFILPYIVALILFYVSNVITSQSTSRIELDTIYELINKIIESISTSKKQINVNDLIIHIKKIGDTKSIYTVLVTYIIPTIIIGIGLLYNFIQIDGKYSLLVILIFIVLMMVTAKLEFDSIDHAYNMENSTNVIYDEIHEIISNIDSVITSNTQEESMEYVKNANDKTYELASINNLHNNNTTYGLQVISIVAILGINYLAYRMYYMKQIDATMLTSTVLLSLLFMDYYNYSVQGVKNLINSIGRYNETRSYFKEFTIIKQSNVKKSKQNILKVNEGNISINNLTINYGNNIILNNVTIQIKGHSVTGLVGSIGSGKTTILKALIGIISYNGDILIDGQILKDCSYESIVENIAYISQHPKLFNKSIYYNINYGSNYTTDEILNKLKNFNLIPFINSFPNGLDTIVGKEGGNISGGQKQLIALIRSLIQNKLILLLDEPSSSLDSKTKNIFIQLIKSIKNKTIIISTHDNQIMSLFDNVIDISKIKNQSYVSEESKYVYTES